MAKDYIDFQDQSHPIAFLITFRCYGTWLHGDNRGSVNRMGRNRFGEPGIPASEGLRNYEFWASKHPAMHLGRKKRKAVEMAIREVCKVRDYPLYKINVRTNHVHIVVGSCAKPERIMNQFKAYATRALRVKGLVRRDQRVWSRHGSTKYIWTEQSLVEAIEYVASGQGKPLE